MPIGVSTRPHTSKPSVGTLLNFANPLVRGMTALVPLAGPLKGQELFSKLLPDNVGSALSVKSDPIYGDYLQHAAPNGNLCFLNTQPAAFNIGVPSTLLTIVNIPSAPSAGLEYEFINKWIVNEDYSLIYDSTPRIIFSTRDNGGTGKQAIGATTTYHDNTWYCVFGGHDGSAPRFRTYKIGTGVNVEDVTGPASGSIENTRTGVGIGGQANAVQNQNIFPGKTLYVAVWNRWLSTFEMSNLAKNPMQIFAPKHEYFNTAAAATGHVFAMSDLDGLGGVGQTRFNRVY